MPFTQYSQATLAAEVLEALADPSAVYWSLDEVYRAINEALLYWGALTSYWRERGQFSTVAATPFYDLSVQLPTLRARTYTFGQLTKEIQYALQEPANGVAGTNMTSQFTIGRLTNALKRARSEFVLDSRLPLTFGPFNFAPAANGRVSLDQTIALIARAAWKDTFSGVFQPLRREDAWGADSYNALWAQTPATLPYAYSMAETRPIELQFIPPAISSGQLHLVYASTPDLTIADGTSFALPDEFALAAKYGAMYDMLSNYSEGFDPLRAQYSLERYNAAVEAAKMMRSVARVQVNNLPVPLDTLWNLDAARPTWQNRQGSPNYAATAYDLVALSDVPNGVYGISCDLVRSAPLPVLTTDYIQVGHEDIPYLFDYTRHVLSFKLGGAEFAATMPLYDNFLQGAAQRNKLLAAKARYLTPLFGQGQIEEAEVPAA